MDDLTLLRAHHDAQPGPSPEAVAEARARLTARMDRVPAGRAPARPRWRVPRLLVGLAGAAALAMAVSAVVTGGDGGAPAPAKEAAEPRTARMILLAAADRAERAPSDGGYWRVTTLSGDRAPSGESLLTSTWITRDGRRWVGTRQSGPSAGPGELIRLKGPAPEPVSVLGPDPSIAGLQALPTDPAALRKLAERNVPAELVQQDRAGYVTQAFVELLTRQPVPPKVRAAAYRALADMPGVTARGRAADGRGRKGAVLSFGDRLPRTTLEIRLIIDPGTAQVLERRLDMRKDGVPARSTTLYLAAGWTDEAPRVPALP